MRCFDFSISIYSTPKPPCCLHWWGMWENLPVLAVLMFACKVGYILAFKCLSSFTGKIPASPYEYGSFGESSADVLPWISLWLFKLRFFFFYQRTTAARWAPRPSLTAPHQPTTTTDTWVGAQTEPGAPPLAHQSPCEAALWPVVRFSATILSLLIRKGAFQTLTVPRSPSRRSRPHRWHPATQSPSNQTQDLVPTNQHCANHTQIWFKFQRWAQILMTWCNPDELLNDSE